MENYDVAVIGAGPGGYVAAIRAAQLGFNTVCIDAWVNAQGKPSPGGTCLNVGCIPSKALLDSSHHFHNIEHLFPVHGIHTEGTNIDVGQMIARKDKVVSQLTRGVAGLFKKNKITWIKGKASFKNANTLAIDPVDNSVAQDISADQIIIATGSVPIDIPVAKTDKQFIVDNEGALSFSEVPKRLGIIGAGVIGLELGSVWRRLGANVTVLEALPEFLSVADRDVATTAKKLFKQQGLDIRLNCKVTNAVVNDVEVIVEYDSPTGSESIVVDKLIVAVGRRPYIDGLNPENAGLELTERGQIKVDANCRTNISNIWAIGDCTHGPMLAHKASEEGVAVAEMIAGQMPTIDHAHIPWVIYTHPEIAWAGKTEAELKQAGIDYNAGKFPFLASGRALSSGESHGFVKILADATTDEILGVHMIGDKVSELMAEAVVAMAFKSSSEDLARIVHAHPTLSEVVHEAALAVAKRPIHI